MERGNWLTDKEINRRIQKTLKFLEENGIDYELFRHPPLPTVEKALVYWKDTGVAHCKNLFLRNHKGNRHYLVSFECHKMLAIRNLEQKIGEGKLSFASPERMVRCLGLYPGSVSPFGLINDIDITEADPKELFPNGHRVKFFIDKELQNADRLSFHPCDNTADAVVSNGDFMKFLNIWGGEYEWIDISNEQL